MSQRIRFRRLLERGFYPRELPPVFRTTEFGSVGATICSTVTGNYVGHTNFLDGATFQANHRTFGVINPINFCLLSNHISRNWTEIAAILRRSKSSLFSVKFPRRQDSLGRSFEKAKFSQKLERQRELSAAFPATLQLDISRFYGSIYTHSVPWAALGKQTAKQRLRARTRPEVWSEDLDRLLRNCNDGQTIGIPIGPDTSRIVSEIILAAVDSQLTANGSGITSTSFVHSIDDYEFGAFDESDAERISATFERILRGFELRSNDRKRLFIRAKDTKLDLWQHEFDAVEEGSSFVDKLFSLLWDLWREHSDSNVVAFALQKFRREIARSSDRSAILQHLCRVLYAAPHLVQWIAPFLVGLSDGGSSPNQLKRLMDWGIEEAARRHDAITVLWFLYLHLHFDQSIKARNLSACLGVESPLVDLMILHARHNSLTSGGSGELGARYNGAILKSDSWLYLYESECRGWSNFSGAARVGTGDDELGLYAILRAGGVRFYDPVAFGVETFEFGLRALDFDLDAAAPEFDEYDADEEWYDY
jgi:hypothetical protein